MNDSRELQGKQTTPYGGCPSEVRVEPRDKKEVLSISPASKRGKDGGQEYAGNLLERILQKDNMSGAYERVVSNKGSHGVDGMTVDEFLPYLKQEWQDIKRRLLEGRYIPSPVRRVEIPKPDGGVRLLGIPTVLDRMIQQAIAQQLVPIFDPDFSDSSFGFRPGRSAKEAVVTAQVYIEDGNTWVVDIDLAKYFDTVNHDILMALVARRVKDKRVLKLIRAYLKSGVMINGIASKTEEGCPQGGPLSPLLSNIMLDELDKELEKRGHQFCRYADDCNIYVKSRKAGERVMASITEFLENRLKLRVNREKSAVDRPWKRKFLGFSFYRNKGGIGIRVHPKSIERLKGKIREVTSRSKAYSIEIRARKLRQITTGWVNYFGIANMKSLAAKLDGWTRRRIRMCFWKQWKRPKTRYNNLIALGISPTKAYQHANTRKGYWRISKSQVLDCTLTNEYLENLGVPSILNRYMIVH